MKIAVNTRLLIKDKLEGIGWFTYETLKRITQNHPEHQFYFIFDRQPNEAFRFSSNVHFIVAHPQARHPILWNLFFEWGIPAALKKIKPDLFISPDGWLSLRAKTKSFAVIHDLNFENYPQFLPWHIRKYYHYFFPRFAAKANRIATVSEYTKNDIHQRYHIDQDNIDVVYNGANDQLKPVSQKTIQETRERYSGGAPYFLFVGLIHPRKNLSTLIKAYDKLKKKYSTHAKLLVAGNIHWWTKDLKEAYGNTSFKEDIIFTGRLQTEELKVVIPSALALTYVSFFEGFGIPVLEAMYCDVPVIASDTSSIPEVGGEAVLYTDPYSADAVCEKMLKILKDEKLRNNLILKGQKQRENFSWDKTAEKLWLSIEKSLH